MTDTEDRDRIAQALRKVMAALGCEEERESGMRYCTTHYVGWLNDVNACVRAETITTAILPLLAEARQQGAREAAERGWREGYYTGKRDHAMSITAGVPYSTVNPYTIPSQEGER